MSDAEALKELYAKIFRARAMLFVCIQALDTGDERTDLEQLSATALRAAYDSIEEAEDELFGLAKQAQSETPAALEMEPEETQA